MKFLRGVGRIRRTCHSNLSRPDVLDRLRRYLIDAGAAWQDADRVQRYRRARALFETVLVRDKHIAAVRPRPEFLPYLALIEATAPIPRCGDRGCHTKESGGGLEGIRTRMIVPPTCSPRAP
jgi:hypothetical protein